jgi:hypothetical protein
MAFDTVESRILQHALHQPVRRNHPNFQSAIESMFERPPDSSEIDLPAALDAVLDGRQFVSGGLTGHGLGYFETRRRSDAVDSADSSFSSDL